MAKVCFVEKDFRAASLSIIDKANDIIEDYFRQGYKLTLRQLYYQFVARDLIENTERSYKRIGSIINDGRLAGLIDWNAIEDRTRNRQMNAHWDSPQEVVDYWAERYKIDMWANQEVRVEVWIEKEALAGVIEKVCRQNDVTFMACRGYMSQSEQYDAAQRFRYYNEEGQRVVLLHLGDHDPSGIDMTRDNRDRLDQLSMAANITVDRLALNFDQIDAYKPPPNPAKLTDSRVGSYIKNYGRQSWELDALEPRVIVDLIQDNIDVYKDPESWEDKVRQRDQEREALSDVADQLRERFGDE